MSLKHFFASTQKSADFNARDLGRQGEDLAAAYLQEKGFLVLARNYRRRLGEVDIIAKEGNTLVFVEVKTRRNKSHGVPEEAVTAAKMRQISRVALEYLSRYKLHDIPARFDVVAVDFAHPSPGPEGKAFSSQSPPLLRHYRNAFDLP